jgi:membrane fusion protein, multidrug efflux system
MTLGRLFNRPGRRRIELTQYRLHAIIAVVLIAAMGCSSNSSSAAKAKAPVKDGAPVVVATVAQKSVAKRVKAIGNVEPYSTVAVKSRVDGQIMAVHFKEGQNVTDGQILFEIDPRPFKAQLMQSEATLMKDKAQYENALAQERRYQDLLQKNFVSKEFYAQIRTNLDSTAAGVRADEAAVENARVQLDYCTIRSPINGRTGKIMIQSGNLVKANDTAPLVVINQVVPIYVAFSVPEQQLQAIRAYMANGPLSVDATAQDAESPRASGELTFIDNTVDATTGTIKLKATFRNSDSSLWPGEFVTATVNLYEQADAVVVPSAAVQTGPNGRYVFVVKPDMTVEMRDIVVDRTEGAETVVAKGLTPGLQVVTDGQLRLTPGAKVNVESRSSAS